MGASQLVSVVVPAHNHQAFVAEALESVVGQTLVPGEVVVVDDGSTDATASVVEGVAHPGLTLLRQENQGAHAALNRAIEAARGPWIAILNSDDAYLPTRVEHALGVAFATGAALVVGRVRLVDHCGVPLPHDHPSAGWYREALARVGEGGALGDALEHHNAAVTTSNFFLHKELWRRLGGFRPYRYVHDLDFLLRALQVAPTRVVVEPGLEGVVYRVHGANTIAEDVDRALGERAEMIRGLRRPNARLAASVAGLGIRRALEVALRDGRGVTPSKGPTAAVRGMGEPSFRCGLVVSELDAGGLEEVVALLATRLPEHGLEPHVLCTGSGGGVARRLVRAGVSVTVARTSADRRRWLGAVRPEVLSMHFSTLEIVAELGGAGLPLVETVHNVYAWFTAGDWRREGEKQRWLRGIVAVSEGAASYYRSHVGEECAPVTVIPNGVTPDRVPSVPAPVARRALGLPPPPAPVLVQLGRIEPSKNQLALAAAFREVAPRHPDAVLVLAGPVGDPKYVARLRREHAALLAVGRIRLMDPRPDVGTLLSAADAFVSDSWFEGWSLAASEALWTGLPVVLSDTGGSREMVGGEGQRGYLVPNALGPLAELGPALLASSVTDPPAEHVGEVVRALGRLLEARASWASRGPGIRAWARSQLAPSRFAADHARLLRGAALTPPGDMG